MARSRTGWKLLIDGSLGGRNVFVLQQHFPLYERIREDHRRNYHLTTLLRTLWTLNTDTTIGRALTPDLRIRQITLHGVALEYYVEDTDVLIRKLIYNSTFRPAIGEQGTALYNVKYTVQNGWKTANSATTRIPVEHQWDGSHYAAVAGKFTSKEAAGRLLIKHIVNAYSKDILEKHVNVIDNHYSLFWSNKSEHNAESTSQALASLIQQAADTRKPVNWLVHGEGALTFQRAMQALKSKPSLIPRQFDPHAEQDLISGLAGQRVYFSNPRGVAEKNLKQLCTTVGMTFEKVNLNRRDLYSPDVRRSAVKEIAKIGAPLATTQGAAWAVTGLKGLPAAAEKLGAAAAALASNPNTANVLLVAGATATAVMVVNGGFTKISSSFLAMRATAATTFGRGNDFWYEDDKNLLEQLSA